MNINLSPYNKYILLAAFIVTIVVIIMTLRKLAIFGQAAIEQQKKLEEVQANVEKLKAGATKPDKKKSPIKPKTILAALLLLNAIRKDYDKEEGTGIKQVKKSTENVIGKQVVRKELQKTLFR